MIITALGAAAMLYSAASAMLLWDEYSLADCVRTSPSVRTSLALSVALLYYNLIAFVGFQGIVTLIVFTGAVVTSWQPCTVWHLFFAAATLLGATTDLVIAGSRIPACLCALCMIAVALPCTTNRQKEIECSFLALFAVGCLFTA